MAPRNQPERLYPTCLKRVSRFIDKTSQTLFLEYGTYVSDDCVEAVNRFRNYLAESLPSTIFEDLAEIRNFVSPSSSSMSDEEEIDDVTKLLPPYYRVTNWIQDPRIKLSLYLHPLLSKFAVDPDGSELLQNQVNGMDEFFWCAHLKRLENLTSLHLNVITTDEILYVVSHHCPKLKDVNIVSKIRETNNMIPPHHRDPLWIGSFSLRLCVSDIGLINLSNCKDLRSIVMNKVVPSLNLVGSSSSSSTSYPSSVGISLNGVRHLVKSLPRLEHLNFGSMGRVLCQGFEPERDWPLNLFYFCEMKTHFVDVPTLEKAVPYLQHISLSAPFSIGVDDTIDASFEEGNRIFEALADSPVLKPKIYEFHNFPCSGKAFHKFLSAKGRYIDELILRSINPIHFREIQFIGRDCPGIKGLTVRGLQGGGAESHYDFVSNRNRKKSFENLTSLIVSGKSWNPNQILPFILSSASLISKISLLNVDCRYTLDGAWEKVMKSNPLRELTAVMFYSGCFISFPLLRRFALEFPKLENINFLLYSDFDISDVENLRQELKKGNYNIRLNCLEIDVI